MVEYKPICAPAITIFTNCDTILALNLQMLDIKEHDELVFTIKNYSYAGSEYVYIHRARLSEANNNGEILFKIPHVASKYLKYGAFYSIMVLKSAFDPKKETSCVRLTDNGRIKLIHGSHDLAVIPDHSELDYEIVGARLEQISESEEINIDSMFVEIVNVRLEQIDA